MHEVERPQIIDQPGVDHQPSPCPLYRFPAADTTDDSGSEAGRDHEGRLAQLVPSAAIARERSADEAEANWRLRVREEVIRQRQAERTALIKMGSRRRFGRDPAAKASFYGPSPKVRLCRLFRV